MLPRALGCSPARLPRSQRELLPQGGFGSSRLPPPAPLQGQRQWGRPASNPRSTDTALPWPNPSLRELNPALEVGPWPGGSKGSRSGVSSALGGWRGGKGGVKVPRNSSCTAVPGLCSHSL